MKDLPAEFNDENEELDEDEKLDQDLHDVEMIIRSRSIDVPLSSNVKVTEIEDKEEAKQSRSEE